MVGSPVMNNTEVLSRFHKQFQHEQATEHHLKHWQKLMAEGFPSQADEDWKYTPLAQFSELNFVRPAPVKVKPERLRQLALPVDAYRLVFVDGELDLTLSELACGEFQLTSLFSYGSKLAHKLPEAINPEVFLHLTEGLARGGISIRLGKNRVAEKPLYLLHINTASSPSMVQSRHHLELELGAEGEVIEHFVSLGDSVSYSGARMTMSVADNARLTHSKYMAESDQAYHFAHNDIFLARDAYARSTCYLLGGQLVRHHSSARCQGEGSRLEMNSISLPVKSQVYDSRTYLEHNLGHCESNQLHKTIIKDQARAVFNGKILVAKGALKTDGQMDNRNLLLGDKAEVYSKPQLEIYADDVKCSHGATTGRIDPEQLFYLRARGIKHSEAYKIITFAFAAELTQEIKDEKCRAWVLARLAERLGEQPV